MRSAIETTAVMAGEGVAGAPPAHQFDRGAATPGGGGVSGGGVSALGGTLYRAGGGTLTGGAVRGATRTGTWLPRVYMHCM